MQRKIYILENERWDDLDCATFLATPHTTFNDAELQMKNEYGYFLEKFKGINLKIEGIYEKNYASIDFEDHNYNWFIAEYILNFDDESVVS